jgi:hypothetical protein
MSFGGCRLSHVVQLDIGHEYFRLYDEAWVMCILGPFVSIKDQSL